MILPQESVLEKELTETKSTWARGKEILPKKKTSQIKRKSKENPKGNTKGKSGKSTKSDKKKMDKGFKNVVFSGKNPGEEHKQRWGEKHWEKVARKENHRRQEWRQSREGSKVTFTDVERLFMILMKGENEEDWKMLANFERDDHTIIYDHKIRSAHNAESLPWTWRYT